MVRFVLHILTLSRANVTRKLSVRNLFVIALVVAFPGEASLGRMPVALHTVATRLSFPLSSGRAMVAVVRLDNLADSHEIPGASVALAGNMGRIAGDMVVLADYGVQ